MSILNTIKSVVSGSIKVEVKSPFSKNGKTKFPVLVTDMGASFTSGWFLQYNPVAQDNGTRLYDGSETFSELNIANFSQLHQLVLTANHYFLQGINVEQLAEGRKRAIYEPTPSIRLTATSQQNSVSIVATITDETSPFCMLSIPFTVVLSNQGNGNYYVVGTDNERWDRNTDTFKEYNANFAPRKGRFYRVIQQQNGPASLRAKIAVKNNQYAINHDGTFEIDTKASSPEYIQVISNEFKALAYIYEQTLIKTAFDMAIAQGLPQVQMQAPVANQQVAGFVPAFNVGGGQAPAFTQPTTTNFSAPTQQAVPAFAQPMQQPSFNVPNAGQPAPAPVAPEQGMQQPVATIDPNNLPWVTN